MNERTRTELERERESVYLSCSSGVSDREQTTECNEKQICPRGGETDGGREGGMEGIDTAKEREV